MGAKDIEIKDIEIKDVIKAISEVRLRVNSEEALRYMQVVRHKGFLKSLRKNWRIDGNGQATIQSICWLFCWSTMGKNNRNKKTSDALRDVFGRIFDHSYEWFAREVPIELVKKWRYAKPKSLIRSLNV